jgi:hypothetical protein
MKIFSILLTLVLMISCTGNSSVNTDNFSQPVVEVFPISNQTAENNPFPVNEIIAINRTKILIFPTPEKISMEEFLRKENRSRLSRFGLYNLETRRVSKDDIEIRVWQINDLYMGIYKELGVKESVFILSRVKGNWSAKVLRNTINQKTGAEKQIKTKLDEPQSGWENTWQIFVENELLTFLDTTGKVNIPDPDVGIFIIVTNVGGVYKTYEHSNNQEIRDVRLRRKYLI